MILVVPPPLPAMYLFGLFKSDRLSLHLRHLCPNCFCCLKGRPHGLVSKPMACKDAGTPFGNHSSDHVFQGLLTTFRLKSKFSKADTSSTAASPKLSGLLIPLLPRRFLGPGLSLAGCWLSPSLLCFQEPACAVPSAWYALPTFFALVKAEDRIALSVQ